MQSSLQDIFGKTVRTLAITSGLAAMAALMTPKGISLAIAFLGISSLAALVASTFGQDLPAIDGEALVASSTIRSTGESLK